ncbi:MULTISPECIES: glycoside hydrolase family 2 TIM barrel-domain containing protein [unclassified Fusibacter]|uniref:glycoside hydrolase family 2 protein n=1 Tax=unclassified Fusibacter TaxID=2624464 RepID=UPI001011C361|nr:MULTISPECIES: glycoside hydrolase family 2 TIM barrel-domain containing protein [unclassified Fusibacter]MCK8060092.1 glycoside hydrolase family 2 protein [Fusibacter sp. A2]NPE22234.1 glycoside hydrolase family 2 protein [Fusibacter sp. A1]RXV61008.1 glycoside hydrolase family 2 protein [Fusibacter sp. A1]
MRKTTMINFDWKYSMDFKEAYILETHDDDLFETVHLPHTNITLPYNNFDEKLYQFESCYRKRLWIDKVETHQRVYVKFEAVMTYARVYLNGHYVGDHKGGYTPFRLDLTDYAVFESENTLVVYVDSTERSDIPPFGFVVDYLTYGGIYREVSLEYCSDVHLENVAVRAKDVLTDALFLDMDLYLHNHKQEKGDLTCAFSILEDETLIKTFKKTLQVSSDLDEKINVQESLADVSHAIKLWGTDHPHLYWLEISLMSGEKLIDRLKIRFGFRDARFSPEGFFLNGERLKIQGINRHQSFPYVGYAMPKSAQYKDAELLKYELGVNAVRLSHYPHSDHFMDRCDELGLLVFDEIPGWQHIGDEAWQETALENVAEMILKDVNHPSVIIWGVRINESQDHDLFYRKTNTLAKSLDDSRPTGGVRCIKNSNPMEDVYTYNDFSHTGKNRGLDKKRSVTKTRKPYLVTEHNGHMFPTKKFDHESHRVEHALRHLNVLDAMRGEDQISGAIGWCMFDYNTHKDFGSGDKICYHGVMDMFRIPKHAAFAYRSQVDGHPVMHVASSFNIGEYKGSLLEDVQVFTNCDHIELYKNDEYVNTFHPNRRRYPHLAHPPIVIDDYIGDAIRNKERFSLKDAKTVKALLLSVSKKGAKLSLGETLKMAWIFFRYKMNTKDAQDLFAKYFGGWGGMATDYVFKGYKDGLCVTEVKKSQVFKPSLLVTIDSTILVEEATYDTTRIVVRLVDDYGNEITYASDTVRVETLGPIEMIGPKVLSLIGGSIGFWIRTTGDQGQAQVIVHSERFGRIKKSVEVVKKRY